MLMRKKNSLLKSTYLSSSNNNWDAFEKILGYSTKKHRLRMIGKEDISSKWYEDFQYEQDISKQLDKRLNYNMMKIVD